jgi:hypothetical protein
MGIVEAFKLGAIVGRPTAGTNGTANSFVLPGGYRVRFTGTKVVKNDGRGITEWASRPLSRAHRPSRASRRGGTRFWRAAWRQ